jgi:hypothetical protein
MGAAHAQVRLASLWLEGTTYYYYSWHSSTGAIDTLWRFKANADAHLLGRGRLAMGTDGLLYGTGDGGEWLRGALCLQRRAQRVQAASGPVPLGQ